MGGQNSHPAWWQMLQIGHPLQVVLGLLEQDLICGWLVYGKIQATQSPWRNRHSRENFPGFRGLTHLNISIFIFLKFNNFGLKSFFFFLNAEYLTC